VLAIELESIYRRWTHQLHEVLNSDITGGTSKDTPLIARDTR
jgi:hypothetical protein